MAKRRLDPVLEKIGELGRKFNFEDAYKRDEIAEHPFTPVTHTLPLIVDTVGRDATLPNHFNCERCFNSALKRSPFSVAITSLGVPCSLFGPESSLIPLAIGQPQPLDDSGKNILNDSHYVDLITKGYTVIDNVLSNSDAKEAVDKMYDWLESLGTGIKRASIIDTCNSKTSPLFVSNGILTYPNPYFIPAAIFVRTHPNVRKVFSCLHGTNDKNLLVSYDRLNFSVPTTNTTNETCKWFHLDQGVKVKDTFDCFQGMVNLTNVSESGGAFACIPGSHFYHGKILDIMTKTFNADASKNFVKPEAQYQTQFLELLKTRFNLEPVVVRPIKPGSMVIWDSRLVHGNVPPKVGSGEIRMAAYVAMVPRSMASSSEIKKRIMYHIQARGTSHSPHRTNVFPKGQPYNYGKSVVNFSSSTTNNEVVRKKALEYFEELANLRGDLDVVVRHYGHDNVTNYNEAKKFHKNSSADEDE